MWKHIRVIFLSLLSLSNLNLLEALHGHISLYYQAFNRPAFWCELVYSFFKKKEKKKRGVTLVDSVAEYCSLEMYFV